MDRTRPLLESVFVRNFRCFGERQEARLAPLTLLVGDNSVGKTSLLALIRALWDIAYNNRIADFKEDPYDLGGFDEIVYAPGTREEPADSFEAGFKYTPVDGTRNLFDHRKDNNSATCQFQVKFEKRSINPYPVIRAISMGDTSVAARINENQLIEFTLTTENGKWKFTSPLAFAGRSETSKPHQFPFIESDRPVPLVSAFNVFLVAKPNSTHPDVQCLAGSPEPTQAEWQRFEALLLDPGPTVNLDVSRVYSGAPVRSRPRRTYDPTGLRDDAEGRNTPTYLASLSYRNIELWKSMKSSLEKFGKDSGLFDEILVKHLGKHESAPFQIRIRKSGDKRRKGPHRNLIDVGYGVSQVLPVITELLRPDASPIYLLQQPEVHLHPSAQAALGSLFCRVANVSRQLIVETHSDRLIDRIRMDVRDGVSSLRPEDLSILFFERRASSVKIHSIGIDGEGNVLRAPNSYGKFFLEETNRSVFGI